MSSGRSWLNLMMAAGLVGLPVAFLAINVERPAWMWLAVFVVGTGAVFACYQHMTAVIEYDREVNPPEPSEAPPLTLRESHDAAMLSLIRALGLMPVFERFAAWLAKRLDRRPPEQ